MCVNNFIKVCFVFLSAIVLLDHATPVNGQIVIVSGPQKLKISLYISSLCKDSKRFLTEKFYSAYQELKDYLDVEFIPWGKAKRDEAGIKCQFGEADCKANKIQSCALHLMGNDQRRQVEYLACEFVNMFSTQGSYQCVEGAGLSGLLVQECAELGLGDALQRVAEQKTAAIPMHFVPTIVYSNHFDQQIQDMAFADFRKTTCAFLGAVCRQ